MALAENLNGKVCLVTGASSGIGKATAAAFAAAGAQVVGIARRFEERSVQGLADGEVLNIHGDVTSEQDISKLVESLPAIDVLVNNAGGAVFDPVSDATLTDTETMLRTHILGTMIVTKAAIPKMTSRPGALIVSVGSVAVTSSFLGSSGYTAAKAGQMAVTRILREELREHKIRVTELLPGATDTAIWDDKSGFERSAMMDASDIAQAVLHVALQKDIMIEQMVLMPRGGSL